MRASTELRSRPRSSGMAASLSWMRDNASATSLWKRWISPAADSRCSLLSSTTNNCCHDSLNIHIQCWLIHSFAQHGYFIFYTSVSSYSQITFQSNVGQSLGQLTHLKISKVFQDTVEYNIYLNTQINTIITLKVMSLVTSPGFVCWFHLDFSALAMSPNNRKSSSSNNVWNIPPVTTHTVSVECSRSCY